MKKTLLALVFIGVLAFALTACGRATPGTAGGSDGVEATLQFWFWDGAMEEAYQAMFATFSEQNPGITIQYSITPWSDYWTRIQTALPAGAGPDIFWLNHANAVSYMPSELLMSLDDMNLDFSPFASSLYQPFTLNGTRYGVPFFFDTIALLYNKDLFDQAGIPHPPRRGWTWEELREAALALTIVEGGEIIQYGISFSTGNQSGSGNFILQNNGHMFNADRTAFDINNAGAIEALQFMYRLIFEDQVAPTPVENAQLNNQGQLFMNGMIAMESIGLWRVSPYYEFLGDRLGIAHLPSRQREAAAVHNLAYVSYANSPNAEAVRLWMEFATTQQHGDYIARVFLPAHAASQPLWFERFSDLDVEVFGEVLEYAFPLQIASQNAGPVGTAIDQEFERLFMGEEGITPEALERMNEAINAVINQ